MLKITQFNFAAKQDTSVAPDQVPRNPGAELYYWLDTTADRLDDALPALQRLCGDEHLCREDLLKVESGVLLVCPHGLGFELREPVRSHQQITMATVTAVLGKQFLATVSDAPSGFLDRMRQACHDDFVHHSQSPGFLLFELADFLCQSYQAELRSFAEEIGRVQERLFENADDAIFKRVAALTSAVYTFRSSLVASREILHELATRKSQYIHETTQPFLEKKGDLLERLSNDLSLESDVLSETLNLYMGFVSHRTNKVVNRLTAISVIFLPLTFLVGVYGMNFEHMPELGWRFSYLVFWTVAFTVFGFSLVFLRRKGWL